MAIDVLKEHIKYFFTKEKLSNCKNNTHLVGVDLKENCLFR